MSYWVDYNMLMSEIALHRSNAQRRILDYKENNKPSLKTSVSAYTQRDFIDRLLYENEVGKEIILMCLERWCKDFKFSTEEVKAMEEQQ